MFGLEFIAKLIKILRSEISPNQISAGFILGMMLGLTPFWSLHNLIIILLILLLKVNIATAIFSFGIFSAIGYLLDPVFHNLGFYLLVDVKSMHGIWSALYNFPVIALSKYNNTVVMGSFVMSLVLLLPVFILVRKGVISYRENIDVKIKEKMQKWKILQIIKSSKIYSLYQKIKSLGD